MQTLRMDHRADSGETPDLDVLLAAICYLMTHYMRCPDRKVSRAIAEHFATLALRDDCHSAILRNAGRRLAVFWREKVDASNAAPFRQLDPTSFGVRVKLH